MDATRRILIAAGPTREPIDAVRFLSNRSSGRLGLALAEAARDAGWDVTLLLGPIERAPPEGVRTERFESAAELQRLLDARWPEADVQVMAAAVSDYRPTTSIVGKLGREDGNVTLELEPTPDLSRRCAERKRPDQLLIGFALEEPDQLRQRAGEKLRRKGVDAIVANPLATMGDHGIEAVVLTAENVAEEPGPMSKDRFARWLMEWIERQRSGEATRTESCSRGPVSR